MINVHFKLNINTHCVNPYKKPINIFKTNNTTPYKYFEILLDN